MFFPPLGTALLPAAGDPSPGPDPTPDPPAETPQAAIDEGLSLLYQDRVQSLATGRSDNLIKQVFNLPSTYKNSREYDADAASVYGIPQSEIITSTNWSIEDAPGGGKSLCHSWRYKRPVGSDGPLWQIAEAHYPGFTKMYFEFDIYATGLAKAFDGTTKFSGKFFPQFHTIDPTAWSARSSYYDPGKDSYFKEASTKVLMHKLGNFRFYGNSSFEFGYFTHYARRGGSWINSDPYTSSKINGHGFSDASVSFPYGAWHNIGLLVANDTNGSNGKAITYYKKAGQTSWSKKMQYTNVDWFGGSATRGLSKAKNTFTCSDGLKNRNVDPVSGFRWAQFALWLMNGGVSDAPDHLPHAQSTLQIHLKNIRVWVPTSEIPS